MAKDIEYIACICKCLFVGSGSFVMVCDVVSKSLFNRKCIKHNNYSEYIDGAFKFFGVCGLNKAEANIYGNSRFNIVLSSWVVFVKLPRSFQLYRSD